MAAFQNSPQEPTITPGEGRVPRRVGQYDLIEPIGRGGMGVVWKATHRHLDQVVAIKFLAPEAWTDPQAVTRFYREMRAVGRVLHPNLVRALDAGEYDGQHVLVMEHVEGRTLREVLQDSGPLPFPVASEMIRQAALGLTAIHAAGMVHRDLKPSNLMLTPDGVVKILDLGLARAGVDHADADLTHSGHLLGTADYMAPEQSDDARSVDARTDLYSLGCTAYALLTGAPPFGGGASPEARVQAHRDTSPQRIRERRRDVPPELDELLMKLLAKRREDRVQTSQDLVRQLAPFSAGVDLRDQFRPRPADAAEAALPILLGDSSVETSKVASASPDATTILKPGATPPPKSLDSAPTHRLAGPWMRRAGLAAAGVFIVGVGATLLILHFSRPKTTDGSIPRDATSSDAPKPDPPPPRTLRDYSKVPPLRWQPLLDQRPVEVFWKPGGGLADWKWRPELQQVDLKHDDFGLIGFGTTSAADFSLQFGIHQIHWSSGVGAFLGLEGWTPEDPQRTWTCQWIHVVEVQSPNAAPSYRVDVEQIDSSLQDGRRRFRRNGYASETVSRPQGEAILELTVSAGRLTRVRFDGKTLRELVESANSTAEPARWTGGFGVLVESGSAEIRSSQYMKSDPGR